jgi:hypothetical protein
MSGGTVGLVQRRRRRSRAEADQLVREFEASGLTRQAFCGGYGLSVAALDKYRRRDGRIAGDGSRMVPVEVMGSLVTPAAIEGGSALWLELANGCRIAVGSGFDPATLKRLVAVLAEA